MIIYTIVATATALTVHDGMLPRSRLRYIADNFRVYTSGAIPTGRKPAVMHMALELCISHHIPAITLKRYVAEDRS